MNWSAEIIKVTPKPSPSGVWLSITADFKPSAEYTETAVLTYKNWLTQPEVMTLDGRHVDGDLLVAAWHLDGGIRKFWRAANPKASGEIRVEHPEDYPPGFYRVSMSNTLSDHMAEAVYHVHSQPRNRREQVIERYPTPYLPNNPHIKAIKPPEIVQLRLGHTHDQHGPGRMPIIDPVKLLAGLKKEQLAVETTWLGVRIHSTRHLLGHTAHIDLTKPYTDNRLVSPDRSRSVKEPMAEPTPQANTRSQIVIPPRPERPTHLSISRS